MEGELVWYMQRGKMMSWIVVQDYVISVLCFTLLTSVLRGQNIFAYD
jgi:hypothetical protein